MGLILGRRACELAHISKRVWSRIRDPTDPDNATRYTRMLTVNKSTYHPHMESEVRHLIGEVNRGSSGSERSIDSYRARLREDPTWARYQKRKDAIPYE